ncbi:ABC transporter permease [Chloroflexia bacterium SDU3-3]|nr:ABC transporter permease [Chloroflexia bacterium SDU3-3]
MRGQVLTYSRSSAQKLGRAGDAARNVPYGVWALLSLLVVLGLWRGLVLWQDYPAFILPTPEAVLQRWLMEMQRGTLLGHTMWTLGESLGGFGLALAVSLVLGYVLAHAPRLERILAPQIAATQAVPIVAIAPLIILWIGADIRSKTLIAALVTFFPILSSTIVALRSVPREVIEAAKLDGASRWELLRAVELPLALPGIFAGVKAGLALATTGAVVGEFVGGSTGLGALINIARGLFDTPLMFAALLTLALLTMLYYLAAALAERLLIRWEP